MTTKYFTYSELLAQLKDNISRSTLPRNASITQIRQLSAGVGLSATITLVSWGPDYHTHPKWSTDNLASWWPLSVEGTGDVRGSYSGTISGTPTKEKELLEEGYQARFYMQFNVAGDYIDVGDITTLDNRQSFTIGFRCRREFTTDAGTIISRWSSSNGDKQFFIRVTSEGRLLCGVAANGSGGLSTFTTGVNTIPENQWISGVVVFNGAQPTPSNRFKIYLDGDEAQTAIVGTMPTTLEYVAGSVYIGHNITNSAHDFKGGLSDIVYFTDAKNESWAQDYANDDISDRIVAGLFVV